MGSLSRYLGQALKPELRELREPAHEYLVEMLRLRDALALAQSDAERDALLREAEAAEVAFALKVREAQRAPQAGEGGEGETREGGAGA